jgi:hypothetical protein
MRARLHFHVDAQFVTANHATRRVHDVDVAGIAFRMKGPLYHQGSAVLPLDETRGREWRLDREPQPQLGLPTRFVRGEAGRHLTPSDADARDHR